MTENTNQQSAPVASQTVERAAPTAVQPPAQGSSAPAVASSPVATAPTSPLKPYAKLSSGEKLKLFTERSRYINSKGLPKIEAEEHARADLGVEPLTEAEKQKLTQPSFFEKIINNKIFVVLGISALFHNQIAKVKEKAVATVQEKVESAKGAVQAKIESAKDSAKEQVAEKLNMKQGAQPAEPVSAVQTPVAPAPVAPPPANEPVELPKKEEVLEQVPTESAQTPVDAPAPAGQQPQMAQAVSQTPVQAGDAPAETGRQTGTVDTNLKQD